MALPARAQPAPDPQPPAEPAPAPADEPQPPNAPPGSPGGPPAPVTTTPPPSPSQVENKAETPPGVQGKWGATFYGFAEGDLMFDTVQGPTEALGNGALPRPAMGMTAAAYTAVHNQFTTSARNSRIGFRFGAPAVDDIKVSGQIEADFNGNQPPGITESSLFGNATLRIRHANVKIETPVVDVLIGQYWQLFGWQPMTQAGGIQYQGLPGEINSRAVQLRLTKIIKAGDIAAELAVAVSRPGQRAGGSPDGQAGLKLSYDKRKAFHIVGGAGSSLDSAAIGISAIGRRFAVAEFKAAPVDEVKRNGYGLAFNALLPVVPATKESRANALTVEGELIIGGALADQYSGLSGGVAQPALPNPMNMTPAPTYTPNVDNGLVIFKADGTLHPVRWTSYAAALQYFLPPSGKLGVIVNYSHLSSDNAHAFGPGNRVFDKQDFLDGNLIFDITPAVRIGADFVWLRQTYVDGLEAPDYRGQFTGILIF
ncbi:MAG: hypothetical protein E6J90_48160 [Deltaproteobacteria bacterium]|nr:MAG: hypothetical protein E6J91_46215 [Deltaproteobacteria bacterium]TMQ05710.1 MAG: hypothetical protein E6J90_48160 [Deltaproteobacteria bacterium]